jgi:hypothetical protein
MSRGPHLDLSDLAAFSAGELSASLFVTRLLQHLTEVCPTCAAELAAAQAERRRGGSEGEADRRPEPGYRSAVSNAWRRARESFSGLEPGIGAGRSEAREHLSLPAGELHALVAAAPAEQLPGLAEELVAACASFLPRTPAEARRLALVALAAVERMSPTAPGGPLAADLEGEARMKLTEAALCEGDRPAAEAALLAAERAAAAGSGEPFLTAEILTLWGALRRSSGRLEEALALCQRAAEVYGAAGEMGRQAAMLAESAALVAARGAPLEGAEVAARALALADSAGDRPGSDRALELFLELAEACWSTESGVPGPAPPPR